MKVRNSFLLLTVVAIVLIAVVLWLGKRKSGEASLNVSPATNTPLPTAAKSNVAGLASAPINPTSAQPNVSSAVAGQTLPALHQDKIGLLKEILQANDADVVFYGQLKDQFGAAVSGAVVSFSIQYKNPEGQGAHGGQVVSDMNGAFTISGYRGANLGIMSKKVGYALATTGTMFRYSRVMPGYFVPDAGNPTVIEMWKLQGAEPLASINQHYKLLYTGEPMNFDLLTRRIVSNGGDIRLTVTRAPGVISGRSRLEWSVRIEAVDGGIMDSGEQEEVVYAAPQEGYQPEMTFIFSTNAPHKWAGGFDHGFFVQSRNGLVYSKLGLGFQINTAPDAPMYITFSGMASTNGSRNWEGSVSQ